MVRKGGRVRGPPRRRARVGGRRAVAAVRPRGGRARGRRRGGVRSARADVGRRRPGHGGRLRRGPEGVVAAARHAGARCGRRPDPGRRLSRRRRDKRRGGPAPPPAQVPAPPPSGWSRHASRVAAAVAFVVYLPSLRGGFLYDDQSVILDNRGIRDLGALGQVFRSDPARPVLSLTWALNYAAFGLEPWSYHLVNVAIHAGNAALAASLFVWMASRSGRAHPAPSALLGACLFAATPMAAETVAYVSSRSTALAALFMLASLRVAVTVLERFSAG